MCFGVSKSHTHGYKSHNRPTGDTVTYKHTHFFKVVFYVKLSYWGTHLRFQSCSLIFLVRIF